MLKAQRSPKIPSRRQASRGLANGNAQIVSSHTSEKIGAVRWSGTTILDIARAVRDNAMFAAPCVCQQLWKFLERIIIVACAWTKNSSVHEQSAGANTKDEMVNSTGAI